MFRFLLPTLVGNKSTSSLGHLYSIWFQFSVQYVGNTIQISVKYLILTFETKRQGFITSSVYYCE